MMVMKKGAAALAAAALVTGALAAGCGSSSSTSGTSGGDDGTAKSGAVAQLEREAKAGVEALRRTQQLTVPTSGPKAASGKRVFVIPCSMAAEGCARPARAAMDAAKAIGWGATLIDPAGDPTKIADAINQAVAAKADGIMLQAIDAAAAGAALRKAKAAGVKVVAWGAINQDNLIDQVVPEEKAFTDSGYAMAQAAYREAGGHLHLIMMRDDEFRVTTKRAEGTMKFVDDCKAAGGDCSIVTTQNFLITNLSTTVPPMAVDTVRKNPNYTVLWGAYDAGLYPMNQALRQAGLTSKGFSVGFDANVANLNDIREGRFQRFTVGSPAVHLGYAQVDALNRLFQGQPVVDEGVRLKLLDKGNAPREGAWDGDVDVRPAYRKLWGI